MPDTIEYALFATRVYDASGDNRTGTPTGWRELTWQRDYNTSGFSAGAYRKGTEIVISYTGTNQTADWLNGNAAALGGLAPATQIFEAMRFYQDVKAENPDATSFTFTGHSLGGGLASLMGVFFDKQSVVFDEAPFLLSAANPIVLAGLGTSMLLNGYTDSDFALYAASFGTLLPFRSGNVSHTYLEGEVLHFLRLIVPAIAGTTNPVSVGDSALGMMDRHAMTLLTAMLGTETFRTAVRKLPNFAPYLMDSTQFGVSDRRSPGKIDLLSSLLRRQYGAEGVSRDGRLDLFSADIAKLIGTVGTAQTNVAVRDALMMASMEYYYAKAIDSGAEHLFAEANGALHFKYSDIGAASYRSLPLLASTAEATVTATDVGGLAAKLMLQDAWHVQSGAGAMTWSATDSDNDAVIGGSGSDVVNAGAGTDIVLGGYGADQLSGGAGNDILIGDGAEDVLDGGDGADSLDGGDGNDRLLGSDGVDSLQGGAGDDIMYGDAGNDILKGGVDNDNMFGGADNDQLDGEGGNDILDGGAGRDQLDGGFDNDILLGHADDDLLEGGDGNDTLVGGSGSDELFGGEGNDELHAGDPDDQSDTTVNQLTGGTGHDKLYGSGGKDLLLGGDDADTLEGGLGADTLRGGAGNDTYRADDQDSINDSDGSGQVYLGQQLLGDAKRKKGETVYKDAAGNRYELAGATLTINGGLKIEQWSNGQLGIRLTEEDDDNLGKELGIDLAVATSFNAAKSWRRPADPILLDLDNDGLETVGLASDIHFDVDADGVLTRTGWAGNDDALLVWDRNANGSIDTGAELFGDFTPLPNGTLAPNGFAALAALDLNGDGILDAADPAFAELKLWRDTSQDGVSQGGEFVTLAAAGIVSLDLTNTLRNQRLANGNTLAREGSFTRADGSTSGMGEFRFASDTFDTQFADPIDVPEDIKTLPTMSGAGKVRELQQAAAQSAAVAGQLAQFQAAATRAEQQALLDQLLAAWADTSGMAATMEQRAAGNYRIQYDAFGGESRAANLDSAAFAASSGSVGSGGTPLSDAGSPYLTEHYRGLIADWSRKLHVLEAFNGQYFFNLPGAPSQTDSANWGLAIQPGSGAGSGTAAAALAALPLMRVNFSQIQIKLLDQAYASLRESVYASLALQTRLKPYLDLVELTIDATGIHLDATVLNQTLADLRASDPENALADLLDLDRYASDLLASSNWEGLANFDTLLPTLPQTQGIADLLAEFGVATLSAADDSAWLGNGADIVLAGDGSDTLYGNEGADRLFGQGGNDSIHGGNGDDILNGGGGSDALYGGAGADRYVYGRGFGDDIIIDSAENGLQRDSVRLTGLAPADIRATTDHADTLTITIRDTNETLTVPTNYWRHDPNGVGQYVFADGTVWSHDDVLRTTVAATTDNDDTIHGSSAGDTIAGQAGNDTLIGNAGNDVIDGGTGNDLLIGSSGWIEINDNGQRRVERDTRPLISPNGNDSYLFGRGDGQDTVIDGDWTAGNSDTLRFKAGVAPADVRLARSGNDLRGGCCANEAWRMAA